jgi:hypothetical protein
MAVIYSVSTTHILRGSFNLLAGHWVLCVSK